VLTYPAYPDGADVQTLVAAAGITLTAAQAALLDGYAAAAAAMWEDLTGQHPFLAAAEDSVRRQDAPVTPSGLLFLDRPLAVLTEISYQPAGSATSQVLAADAYQALPINAAADLVPYHGLIFRGHRWGAPLGYWYRGSLYVEGRWGYTTELPANVWEGIRSQAALKLVVAQTVGAIGAISAWKDGNRGINYRPLAETVSGWQQAWGSIAAMTAAYRNYRV
jgi:hypothetical protein